MDEGSISNPREALGVSPEAGDQEIREAYLQRIKEHPPDRDPEKFERIRDAYELLRDPLRRTLSLLTSINPDDPLVSLVRGARRRTVGLEPWLRALGEYK